MNPAPPVIRNFMPLRLPSAAPPRLNSRAGFAPAILAPRQASAGMSAVDRQSQPRPARAVSCDPAANLEAVGTADQPGASRSPAQAPGELPGSALTRLL